MEPRRIASIPRRRVPGYHDIWLNPDGSMTCTCPAGSYGTRCWALNKVAGQMRVAEILGQEMETPDIVTLSEILERAKVHVRVQVSPTLEQDKAYEAGTKALHEVSRQQYNKTVWDAYYSQWRKSS